MLKVLLFLLTIVAFVIYLLAFVVYNVFTLIFLFEKRPWSEYYGYNSRNFFWGDETYYDPNASL